MLKSWPPPLEDHKSILRWGPGIVTMRHPVMEFAGKASSSLLLFWWWGGWISLGLYSHRDKLPHPKPKSHGATWPHAKSSKTLNHNKPFLCIYYLKCVLQKADWYSWADVGGLALKHIGSFLFLEILGVPTGHLTTGTYTISSGLRGYCRPRETIGADGLGEAVRKVVFGLPRLNPVNSRGFPVLRAKRCSHAKRN